MTDSTRFYKVVFRELLPWRIDGRTEFYFGSLAAIYETFTVEDIGCKVTQLWRVKFGPGSPYENKKCTISQESLIRKKTNRGKNGK